MRLILRTNDTYGEKCQFELVQGSSNTPDVGSSINPTFEHYELFLLCLGLNKLPRNEIGGPSY